jgi:hypothetical protein
LQARAGGSTLDTVQRVIDCAPGAVRDGVVWHHYKGDG